MIHRDIKLENILIDNEGIIKIADFGISKETKAEQNHKLKDKCGTPVYMAPEMISKQVKREGYSHSVDVWAAGVILYVMIYGQMPVKGKNDLDIFKDISNGEILFKETATVMCIDLLRGILKKDPNERLKVG